MSQKTVTVQLHIDTTAFRRALRKLIRESIVTRRKINRATSLMGRRKQLIHKGGKPIGR